MIKNREHLQRKKRVVIKVGTSSLVHKETGYINLVKLEKLVRVISDIRNRGIDVVLVSSGAISVGRKALGIQGRPSSVAQKQACAAVGQGQLMMIYQKLFAEYNQTSAQILMTKTTILKELNRTNAQNTFEELLRMGVITVVNENDTVSTEEIEFGDNDNLSAVVSALVKADLLILLSDIDGLYTDDPNKNKDAKLISIVTEINEELQKMAKGVSSDFGTGGMATKIAAARIANDSGADMIIANGADFGILNDIMEGKEIGTLFLAHKNPNFDVMDYIERKSYLRVEAQYDKLQTNALSANDKKE
ncbi:MAG: glutamate 5-kinase [Clostridiales bacterium]|nr:glutamate 5-kinase [Clostridiales bacterium]